MLTALSSFLRRGGVQGGAELFSWNLMTGGIGMVQRCAKVQGFRLRVSISLLRGWSYTGTGFCKTWSMPQAYQCIRYLDNALNREL